MATKIGEYGEVEIRHSNNDGNYSIKNAAMLGGQNLVKGTVVGKVTTAGVDEGKLKAWSPANSDGSQTAVGILKQTVNAVYPDGDPEDTETGYYTQGGFQESRLTYPVGEVGWRTQLGAKRDPSIDYVAIYA